MDKSISPPYRSYEDFCSTYRDMGHAAQGVEPIEYGTSTQGRPLRALRIPCTSDTAGAKKYLVTATLHGIEWIGGLIVLELLRRLLDCNDVRASELRSRFEFWLIPCANPDGYVATWEAQGIGPLAKMRTNGAGVDLNRNFTKPGTTWAPSWLGAGSNREGDATFRGTHALSEPESLSLARLCEAKGFHLSANLHSFMGTVIPARVTNRHDYAIYQHLAKSFSRGKTGPYYPRVASRWLDTFTGELEDFQHHFCGTWALCIETYPWLHSIRQYRHGEPLFWRFNPRHPTLLIERDTNGLLSLFEAASSLARPIQRAELVSSSSA